MTQKIKRLRSKHAIWGLLLLITLHVLPAAARGNSSKEVNAAYAVRNEALAKILPNYTAWNKAEFSGKLIYEKLPLKPTVKVFMERGSLVQISVRAPFMGEVARIEMTPDSIVAVNKMQKKYCVESLERAEQMFPDLISYVQNFLLGRVMVLGSGELNESNAGAFDYAGDSMQGWMLLPVGYDQEGPDEMTYAFFVTPGGRTSALVVSVPSADVFAGAEYDYSGSGVRISLNADVKNKKGLEAELDFNSVKWGGSRMSPLSLSGMRRVGIAELVK